MIGSSRLLEGDHWLFDVLGGYLVGALWIAFFIFLYRRTAHLLTRERLKKLVTKRISVPQAPAPLEEYVRQFDPVFGKSNQREGFRGYLAGCCYLQSGIKR